MGQRLHPPPRQQGHEGSQQGRHQQRPRRHDGRQALFLRRQEGLRAGDLHAPQPPAHLHVVPDVPAAHGKIVAHVQRLGWLRLRVRGQPDVVHGQQQPVQVAPVAHAVHQDADADQRPHSAQKARLLAWRRRQEHWQPDVDGRPSRAFLSHGKGRRNDQRASVACYQVALHVGGLGLDVQPLDLLVALHRPDEVDHEVLRHIQHRVNGEMRRQAAVHMGIDPGADFER